MNLNTIENISYPEKKLLVKEACLMFAKIKLASGFVAAKQTKLNDYVQESNIGNIKTASLFETALELLTKEEKRVIENDFINKTNSQWWLDFWAKSTYYKIKHQAINKFLYLLYV